MTGARFSDLAQVSGTNGLSEATRAARAGEVPTAP